MIVCKPKADITQHAMFLAHAATNYHKPFTLFQKYNQNLHSFSEIGLKFLNILSMVDWLILILHIIEHKTKKSDITL